MNGNKSGENTKSIPMFQPQTKTAPDRAPTGELDIKLLEEQGGLPTVIVHLPLRPRPAWRRRLAFLGMLAFAQAILYRGAGFLVVWRQFLIVAVIGRVFLGLALFRFRRVSSVM